ncbi:MULTISPECIES: MauE/DoxX family redox-associated membrane protein [Francisellaceae]|uniref:MauE/DoxX family redox-associated membrane protein n=1 Tax=Francisellaceae TaxID=34064 RepID=UPI0008F9BBEF|nr:MULTISPECIES: MauE/DoxX family redox-associated membrane protein [Francisellaceae]OIN83381.1 glutaredoxin family protein [Francisella sp. TX07-6608]TDT66927.1 glutaredoxin [Allofrancisella inopinata]
MSDNQQNIVKKATLYQMVTDEHICPYGIRAKDLLKRKGYEVEDNHLKTREEADRFKEKYNVKTTPQIFIDSKRIGGYDDLLVFLGEDKLKKEKSYTPVIAVFAIAFLLASTISYTYGLGFISIIKLFMGFSISILAMLKLQDIESFLNQFITYDLLAIRWLRYAYIYPIAETLIGIGIVASIFTSFIGVIAIIIGSIGAVSVYYAVYIQKRELKCACVGGNSKVPLGFLSLTENIMMIVMGIWMLYI